MSIGSILLPPQLSEITWPFISVPLAAITAPGIVELALLTTAAMLPHRRRPEATSLGGRTAVVIPAHNEQHTIARTIRSILAACPEGLDVVVVVIADNCEDATAANAEQAGARVLVRCNQYERGKGYALDFAFQRLLPEGFDYFVIVDADSIVDRNFVACIVSMLEAGAEAVQCRYKVANPSASRRTRLMNVALLAYNVLRPRGRDRLGVSAGILGNGFALPADTLKAVPYHAGSVVEDVEYHVRLIRAGKRVRFADDTTVWGDMPASGQGVSTQRARWEGGRFLMLRQHAPGLLREVMRGNAASAEPLLDLLLLPLALHVGLLLLTAVIPFWFTQMYAVVGLAIVLMHVLLAIAVGGGNWRDVFTLATAPAYMLWKVTALPSIVRASRTNAAWVRTARNESSGEG